MSYDYSQAGYSPDVLEYMNGLEQQRIGLWQKYAGQNVGLDDPDILKPKQVQQEASDGFTTQYAPEEVVRAYMAQHPDNAQNNLNAGVDIRSYGDSRDPSVYDTVRLPFGDNYTFTNKATGQTYNASTPEQLQAVRQAVSGLSTIGTAPMKDSNYGGGNNIANWEIKNGAGERIAYDSPYTPSFLKQAGQTIADIGKDYALPALGMMMGPGGAMMTSFIGGTIDDKSTEDLAMDVGMAGAKAYAAQYAAPYLNSALTDAGLGGSTVDQLFPKTPSGFWGPYATVNPSFAGPSPSYDSGAALAKILGGAEPGVLPGVAGLGSQYLGSAGGVESAIVRPDIKALQVAFPGLSAAQLAQLATMPQYDATPADPYSGETEAVTVTDKALKPFDIRALPVAAGLGGLGALAALPSSPADPYTGQTEEAVVSANKLKPFEIKPDLSVLAPPIAAATLASSLALPGAPAAPAKEPSMWDTALKYSPLALALLGAAGGSGGAGGADGGTGVYHAPEKLPDIFSAKLPNYNALPSYAPATANTGSNSGGAYMGEEDWYTYGRRPEKSFFSNIPGTPIGKAKGGSISARETAQQPRSLAVKGPGTGRSDDIPARLSDGEYVMDAETVALLGDGSSKAGADRLDRFRVNVRKHKGKSLAAGRFSVAAKQPEAYLKGRK